MSQLNATRFLLRNQSANNTPSGNKPNDISIGNSLPAKSLARDLGLSQGPQSIENVDSSTLPANVLVLLSKFSKVLKDYNGTTIQLSSLDVFSEVHDAALLCEDPLVQRLHRKLVVLIRSHIQLGSMYLNGEKGKLSTYGASVGHNKSGKSTLKRRRKLRLDAIVKQSPYNKASASNVAKLNQLQNGYERSISVLN